MSFSIQNHDAMTIRGYAATAAAETLQPFEYDPGELRSDEVEIDVDYCGICHSDLSMVDNAWLMSAYPFVPGHEVSGTVAAVGDAVTHLDVGDKVGLGWYARSCGTCGQCLSGNQNLCPDAAGLIVGRHGGFAEKVRAQATWCVPLPDGVDPVTAGPLFCGGITVFNPIVQLGVLPTDRVGVVGIGGLGHLALQFLRAWGCEVTAFSSSPSKEADARGLGAHHFVASGDRSALDAVAGRFDVILVTVNVALDWEAYVAALRPRGRLHLVGAAPEVGSAVFPLIAGQKSISGSPLGSPATTATMLDFAARHGVAPHTEVFPMSQVNEAMRKLRTDHPAHRLVLKSDFS